MCAPGLVRHASAVKSAAAFHRERRGQVDEAGAGRYEFGHPWSLTIRAGARIVRDGPQFSEHGTPGSQSRSLSWIRCNDTRTGK